jgi:hypothetical protein
MSISLSDGRILVPEISKTSNNVNFHFRADIPYGIITKIKFDTAGNNNFAALDPTGIVRPSGINFYSNITITTPTQWVYNTPNNFQLLLPMNTLSFSNFCSFTCVSDTANNLVVFNTSTGVIYKSWLAGNTLNFYQTTGFNSVANIPIWVQIPNSLITGSTYVNTIAIGFFDRATNKFDGLTVGEAPQLSTSYAQYDNGNTLFNFYDNFTGSSLNSKWNTKLVNLGSITVQNGVRLFSGSTVGGVADIGTAKSSVICEGGIVPNGAKFVYNTTTNSLDVFGRFTDKTSRYENSGWCSALAVGYITPDGTNAYTLFNSNNGGSSYVTGAQLNPQGSLTKNNIISIAQNTIIPISNTIFAGLNFSYVASTTVGAAINSISSIYINSEHDNVGGTTPNTLVQWVRVRYTPSNNIMPTVIFSPPIRVTTIVVPVNILTQIPITITNTANSPTAPSYQQLLSFPSSTYQSSLTGNLMNLEFSFINGTLIQSWLMQNFSNTATDTPIWIRMHPSIASLNSITIYADLASVNQNLLDGVTVGAAANYSSIYGQMDTGNVVFTYSNNFNGITLTGDIANQNPLKLIITQNNSLSLRSNVLSGSNAISIPFSYNSLNSSKVVDVYGNWFGRAKAQSDRLGLFLDAPNSIQNIRGAIGGLELNMRVTGQVTNTLDVESQGSVLNTVTANLVAPYNAIFSFMLSPNSIGTNVMTATIYNGVNNPNIIGATVSNSLISTGQFYTGYFGFLIGAQGLGQEANALWIHLRVPPPNAIMPTVVFGTANNIITAILSFSNGNTISYGTFDLVTATCTNGANCALQQNGVTITNAITTTSFNYNIKAPACYSMSANDLSFSGFNSTANVLCISQANPLIWFPNFPSNHIFNNAPDTLTANINTVFNQLAANDFINGALITQFFTQNSIQRVSVGCYTMLANTLGNGNYLSGTNTISYCISNGIISRSFIFRNVATWLTENTISDNTVTWNASDYLNFTSYVPFNITAILGNNDGNLAGNILLDGSSIASFGEGTTSQKKYKINDLSNAVAHNWTFRVNGDGNYVGVNEIYIINVININAISTSTTTIGSFGSGGGFLISLSMIYGVISLIFAILYGIPKDQKLKLVFLIGCLAFMLSTFVFGTGAIASTDSYVTLTGNTIILYKYASISDSNSQYMIWSLIFLIFLILLFSYISSRKREMTEKLHRKN